tara:strand:+ start:2424 stop:3293 length:870 start_codon:yes stop_codon:yes gene_type:complete
MRAHRLRAAAGNASSGGGGSIVTTNLRRHYDFGDTNCYNTSVSNTAVTDLSGNSRDAAWSAGPIFNSANGGYIQMGSGSASQLKSNSKVGALSRVVGTGAYTIEFWLNAYTPNNTSHVGNWYNDMPTNIVFSPQFVFTYYGFRALRQNAYNWSGWGHYGSQNYYSYNFTTGTVTPSYGAQVYDGSNSSYPQPTFVSGAYSTNGYQGWEHIVLTRSGTSTNGLKFYRNNTLEFTGTSTINYAAPASAAGDLDYGNAPSSRFAVLREYTYGFTATDVAQNYNAQKARFGLS